MRRNVWVDGELMPVEWRREGDAIVFRIGEGPEQQASAVEVERGVYSVLLAGRSHEARITQEAGDWTVETAGNRHSVVVRDPREWSAGEANNSRSGHQEIRAPMPGKVVRVLVEAGQTVAVGQGVLVLEAMKMQNEMQASRSGTVSAIRVAAGDAITAGQVLAVID